MRKPTKWRLPHNASTMFHPFSFRVPYIFRRMMSRKLVQHNFVWIPFAGGIFSALCPKVDVLGTISFTDNTAVLDGGAISLTDPVEFYVLGSSFSSNQAGSGGAVSLSATEPTAGGFERCVFDTNLASNGGALYLSTGDTSDTAVPNFVQDSVFRNNVAGETSPIYRPMLR